MVFEEVKLGVRGGEGPLNMNDAPPSSLLDPKRVQLC